MDKNRDERKKAFSATRPKIHTVSKKPSALIFCVWPHGINMADVLKVYLKSTQIQYSQIIPFIQCVMPRLL